MTTPLKALIENKITEWRGKTIIDHEHFLEELKVLIADVYEAGKREGIEEVENMVEEMNVGRDERDCKLQVIKNIASLKDKSE